MAGVAMVSRRLSRPLLLATLVSAVALPAAAQESPSPPRAAPAAAVSDQPPASPPAKPKPTYTTRWYGWQMLIADDVSGVVFVGTAAGGAPTAAIISGAVFVTAGPIIHFAHGHVARGLASLGLHAGLPLAMGFALSGGQPTDNCKGSLDDGCGGHALAFGFGVLLGMAGAMAIDTAVLARDKVEVKPQVAITPMLGRHRAGLALGGAF